MFFFLEFFPNCIRLFLCEPRLILQFLKYSLTLLFFMSFFSYILFFMVFLFFLRVYMVYAGSIRLDLDWGNRSDGRGVYAAERQLKPGCCLASRIVVSIVSIFPSVRWSSLESRWDWGSTNIHSYLCLVFFFSSATDTSIYLITCTYSISFSNGLSRFFHKTLGRSSELSSPGPIPNTPKPQTQIPNTKGPWADTKIL